jgi:predicted dehydrogenase
MKTGIAVIGAGRWGVHFVRNLARHPLGELLAIVDPHPARLAYCQKTFNLNSDRVVLTTDWESIKKLDNLQAVVIATPASTHYDLIRDALHCGYHVLAEKPLTLDPAECLELTELAAEKQLQLLVDHIYLFNPVVEKGQTIVQSRQLGDLRYGYATRTHLAPVRQDVDALWDLAIHDIAIFNHWLGQSPCKVQARGRTWLQLEQTMSISCQRGLADLVWLTLIYPDGFEAEIHLSWLNPDKQRRLAIVGSEGTLIFDEMSPHEPLTLQQGSLTQKEGTFTPINQSKQIIDVAAVETIGRVCDRFLDNIRTDRPNSVSSGWLGTELVKILRCLTLSMEQQGAMITI